MSSRGDRRTSANYFPALDGLRAVSILAVLAGHFGVTRLRGSVHGVTVFFVISGYLITSLLLDEADREGRIRLGAFYRRRFARLMPAFVAALAVTAVALLISGHPVNAWLPALFFSATYVVNQTAAHSDLNPIGEAFFVHNWSLAIEEQFYFGWAPVLALLAVRRRKVLLWLAAGTTLSSAAYRLACQHLGAAEVYVKWATETRLDAIMSGCALALLFAAHPRLYAWRDQWSTWLAAAGAGLLGILLLQGALIRWDPGGYTAATVAGLLLVASAPATPALLRPLTWPPVIWVGTLSYSLYLWNVLLLRGYESVTGRPPIGSAAGWTWPLAVVGVAWASYTAIERPLRRRLSGTANDQRPWRESRRTK